MRFFSIFGAIVLAVFIGWSVGGDGGEVDVVVPIAGDGLEKVKFEVVAVKKVVVEVEDWREKLGVEAYEYLYPEGGPQLLIPESLGKFWKGRMSRENRASDFSRAEKATLHRRLGAVRVGKGVGVVMQDPVMAAWGRSPEGWIDVYYIGGWDSELDGMIDRAVASISTGEMRDTGRGLSLSEKGAVLMCASSGVSGAKRNRLHIPLGPGRYRMLEGKFKGGDGEDLTIYRLVPVVALADL